MIGLCHVITGLGTGGAERMLATLATASHGRSCTHHVISLMGLGTQGEVLRRAGVPVDVVGMNPAFPSPLALRKVRRLIRNAEPDVIHGWMYHGALVALLARGNRPIVVGIHHSLGDVNREKLGTRLVIRALRHLSARADTMLYCSSTSKRQHEDFGFSAAAASVVPNGFDCDVFRPSDVSRRRMRESLSLDDRHFVFGHLGRFHPMKDHRNLLEAAVAISAEIPHARFVLAGRDVCWSNPVLSRSVSELGLSDRVLLLGERSDVPEILAAMDVVVSSSRWGEAFPIVLGEAMACGVPCITTDVGDSGYLVGDSRWVVESGNAAALAERCVSLATKDEDERRTLGGAARQRIIDHFSIDEVARMHSALYRSLAVGHRPK